MTIQMAILKVELLVFVVPVSIITIIGFVGVFILLLSGFDFVPWFLYLELPVIASVCALVAITSISQTYFDEGTAGLQTKRWYLKLIPIMAGLYFSLGAWTYYLLGLNVPLLDQKLAIFCLCGLPTVIPGIHVIVLLIYANKLISD